MKKRLDVLVTEKGLFESREKAKACIMAGLVYVDGQIADKAGMQVAEDADISVKEVCPYVSRGGYKIEKALDVFGIDVSGLHCIDIGASTGGFTDCLLQRGAEKVYSVDVGTNQLAYKLRVDPRVVSMENVNFRNFDPEDLPEKVDFACADVSFISLRLILPVAASVVKDGAICVCLIKPQFEAGREEVGKHGIVKDKSVHEQVIKNVIKYAEEAGFGAYRLSFSPIMGGKSGNIEYLIELVKGGASNEFDIKHTINEAFEFHVDKEA